MDILKNKFKFPNKKPNLKKKLEGWLAKGNKILLNKYISKNTKLIIEFGSWLGLSADYMFKHSHKDCIIICVDWWKGDTSIGYVDDEDKLYNTFIVNMWEYKDRLIPLRMDGRDAIKYLSELNINPDLIYLDMDHSYDSAKLDLELLLKYFPNKLILGDDILFWPGVAKAVKEIIYEFEIPKLEINQNCYALLPKKYKISKQFIPFKKNEYISKGFIYNNLLNNNTKLNKKIALIIGYNKNEYTINQLNIFYKKIFSFMLKLNVDFKIFIIHQPSDKKYNLGMLYNIGFKEATKLNYDTFIFHSIEYIPEKSMKKYYLMYPKNPIKLSFNIKDYIFQDYFVPIIMINSQDFIKLNGYPNNIIDWGGWDYELLLRLKNLNIEIYIPYDGNLENVNNSIILSQEKWYIKKKKYKNIIKKNYLNRDINGLNNLKYNIKKIKKINNNCIHIKL